MTVICATHHEFVPLLMSDVLLSDLGAGDHFEPSTYDKPLRVLPDNSLNRLSGILCKLVIIRPTLAMGWAGTKFAAQSILKFLCEQLSEYPSIDEIESMLKDEVGCDVTLIGTCVIGGEFGSFNWNGTNGEFTRGLHFIEGSGSERLKTVITSEGFFRQPTSSDFNSVYKACGWGIQRISELLGDEIFRGDNLPEFFGAGFDLIYFSGKFERVASVCQFFISIRPTLFRASGRYRLDIGSHGTSLWQRFRSGLEIERIDFLSGTKELANGGFRRRIGRVKRSKAALLNGVDRGSPSPDAPNFCVIQTHVHNENGIFARGTRVFPLPNRDVRVIRRDGKVTLSLSKDALEGLATTDFLKSDIVQANIATI